MKIRIAEIFESISGEVGGFPQGSPTGFAAGLQGLSERVRPKVAISVLGGKRPWAPLGRSNIQEAVKAILASKISILLNTQIHVVFGVR